MYVYLRTRTYTWLHVYTEAEVGSQFRGLVLADNINFYGKIKFYEGLLKLGEFQPP